MRSVVDAMKKFNITAVCVPSKRYMVDLSVRVDKIKRWLTLVSTLPSIGQGSMERRLP